MTAQKAPRLIHRRWNIQSYNKPIESVVQQVQRGDIDMNPAYQRGAVWDTERKEALIDSLAIGLGIPEIYLRELQMFSTVPFLEILDGKQRLLTLKEFLEDGFPYKGKLYGEMCEADQRWFMLSGCIVVKQVSGLTDEEAVLLFERLNFNGVPQDRAAYEARKRDAR